MKPLRVLLLAADSDRDGQPDGWEDSNLNGRLDLGEGDPNDPMVLSSQPDSDGDGLCDAMEVTIGSRPHDADSDDDGVPDGQECNPAVDLDNDGQNAVNDEDSDGDGLFDGTEIGLTLATLLFVVSSLLGVWLYKRHRRLLTGVTTPEQVAQANPNDPVRDSL